MSNNKTDKPPAVTLRGLSIQFDSNGQHDQAEQIIEALNDLLQFEGDRFGNAQVIYDTGRIWTENPDNAVGRLYVETDGDRYPKDVYICEDGGSDRICTMNSSNERRMVAMAREMVEAVNRNFYRTEGK